MVWKEKIHCPHFWGVYFFQLCLFLFHAVKKHFIHRGKINVTALSGWGICDRNKEVRRLAFRWTEPACNASKQKVVKGLTDQQPARQPLCGVAKNPRHVCDWSRTNRWGIIHTKGKGWCIPLPSEIGDMELHNLPPKKNVSRTFKSQVIRRQRLRDKTLLIVQVLFLWKMCNDFLRHSQKRPVTV